MASSSRISFDSIQRARARLGSLVIRTPLVPLDGADGPGRTYLKLENLQPTGSFKVRGAGNSILAALERGPVQGVYTTSAGNMAQALAWHAQRIGLPCTTIVPDTAPQAKLAGIRRFGAEIVQLTWDEVWQITLRGVYPPFQDRLYVPPFNHPDMIAGNGTIGAEIFEDLPEVEEVYVPIGGGGLITGIASALKARKPAVRVIACEPETATAFTASLKAGKASQVVRTPTFVDGSGASSVFPEMWDRLRDLVTESRVVSLQDTASAIRFLFERHRIVAEGAAGTAVAAARGEPERPSTRVAVVSGGNIDPAKLMTILSGGVP
jgi:threonine dehydratase